MSNSWIRRLFKKLYSKPYLIVTNTVTGVVSISIGDVLQQNLEHAWSGNGKVHSLPSTAAAEDESQHLTDGRVSNNLVWDSERTKYMMYAGAYFSIFGHYWFTFLDKRFPPNSLNAVRNKVFAEVAMGPPLVSSTFFIVGSMKGQSLSQCWEYMKSNFMVICSVEWLVYIPLQWLNFSYVPAQFRYLFVASISIGYDAFLSFILHRNERQQQRLLSKEQPEVNENEIVK